MAVLNSQSMKELLSSLSMSTAILKNFCTQKISEVRIIKGIHTYKYWSLMLYLKNRLKNHCFYNINVSMLSSAILKNFFNKKILDFSREYTLNSADHSESFNFLLPCLPCVSILVFLKHFVIHHLFRQNISISQKYTITLTALST